MEIKPGDYVNIVGDCKETHRRYSLVYGMKRYMNTDIAYRVEKATSDSVLIEGYRWSTNDVILAEKSKIVDEKTPSEQSTTKKSTIFKFDEKHLDI